MERSGIMTGIKFLCTLDISSTPGVSFTKLSDASYDQLTRRRSHKLILLTNCCITLGCVARALPCVAPRYAACRELHWYAITGHTNSTYKHLCERPPLNSFQHLEETATPALDIIC